jgi:hypothetical protein
MLLATVLSALLMVGLLAVVVSLGKPVLRQGGRQVAAAADAGPVEAVVRMLREDVQHAAELKSTAAGELRFIGYQALTGAGRATVHRPVEVVYRAEVVEGRTWLVRRQAALDVTTNQGVQRDLVASNITGLSVGVDGGQWRVSLTMGGAGEEPRTINRILVTRPVVAGQDQDEEQDRERAAEEQR